MRTSSIPYLLLAGLLAAACEEKAKAPAPEKLQADFTHTGTAQNFTPLQFTSIAPGAETYEWSFGDGTSSTQANPAHTFRRAGTYAVRLRTNGTRGPAEVTKSLVLAQSDTVSLIVSQVLGQYRFGKVVKYEYRRSGPTGPVNAFYRLLPDTIMTITRQGQNITVLNRTFSLDGLWVPGGPPRQFIPVPMPVWGNGNSISHYWFKDSSDPRFYTHVYAKQQEDSVIIVKQFSALGGADSYAYYGRKIR